MAPIPITIITGFLGSGKTTLILNLIPQLRAQNPSYRLALLKNEFGDLAIDSQLASSSSISSVRELLNGCICCNLVGQLAPALADLRARASPDRIVIETSGSAFPATLALEVNRLARDTGAYVLDGVVSVVDVENWAGYEDTSYTARIQARYTDLVVLNKWEAAGEDRYEEVLDRLGDLEVDVARVKSDKGWVGVDVVFGVDGALAAAQLSDVEADLGPKPTTNCDGHDGHEEKKHASHSHQSEVEVLSVKFDGQQQQQQEEEEEEEEEKEEKEALAVSTDKFLAFLTSTPKDEVYRIKAVVTLASPPRNSDPDAPPPEEHTGGRYILNWAFGRWTFTPLVGGTEEHASSSDAALRLTMVLGRYESNKWKKKLEAGGLIELAAGEGDLIVKRLL